MSIDTDRDSGALAGRDWWEWLPVDDRDLYREAGYLERQRFSSPSCLLVIDVNQAFTGTRPMPIREAAKEFPTSCGQAAWDALPAIESLLRTYRAIGLPVVYTGRDQEAQAAIRQTATKRVGGASTAQGADFLPQVAPATNEWVCRKARSSAFYGTPLLPYLLRHDVRSVVLCGGLTSTCVRATATDAFSAGFQVLVAENGCFDRTRPQHLANLFDLNAKVGTVLRADEVIAQLAL